MQLTLRCDSWSKTLLVNHRRPSGVATGRVVGDIDDAIAIDGIVVGVMVGILCSGVKPVGSVCSASAGDLATAAGLPASVVRTLGELVGHPHVQERGVLQPVRVPESADPVVIVGAGFQFEHDAPRFQGPVPRLGEHTRDVLTELGLDTCG